MAFCLIQDFPAEGTDRSTTNYDYVAAKVGDDVDTSGYALGVVTNSDVPADESMVMFERGHEEEARAVASDLGIDQVDLIDSGSSALADGADVVVIAGEDRAQF